jgi:hypothetical protein
VEHDVNYEASDDDEGVEAVEVGFEIAKPKGQYGDEEFEEEQAREDEAGDGEGGAHAVPRRARGAFFAGVEVDEYVCENGEEIGGDEAQDTPAGKEGLIELTRVDWVGVLCSSRYQGDRSGLEGKRNLLLRPRG